MLSAHYYISAGGGSSEATLEISESKFKLHFFSHWMGSEKYVTTIEGILLTSYENIEKYFKNIFAANDGNSQFELLATHITYEKKIPDEINTTNTKKR